MVDGDPERLPLPQARGGRHDGEGPVPGGDRVDHGEDLLGRQRDDRRGVLDREADATAGAAEDDPVGHAGVEHRPHPPVRHLEARGRQRVAAALHPRLDLRGADGGQRTGAECRKDVEAEGPLDHRRRRLVVDLRRAPRRAVVAEDLPAEQRVDPLATNLVGLGCGPELVGVDLPVEGLRPLPAIRGAVRALPPAAGQLLGVVHARFPSPSRPLST